jgi:hypothetical protein
VGGVVDNWKLPTKRSSSPLRLVKIVAREGDGVKANVEPLLPLLLLALLVLTLPDPT